MPGRHSSHDASRLYYAATPQTTEREPGATNTCELLFAIPLFSLGLNRELSYQEEADRLGPSDVSSCFYCPSWCYMLNGESPLAPRRRPHRFQPRGVLLRGGFLRRFPRRQQQAITIGLLRLAVWCRASFSRRRGRRHASSRGLRTALLRPAAESHWHGGFARCNRNRSRCASSGRRRRSRRRRRRRNSRGRSGGCVPCV